MTSAMIMVSSAVENVRNSTMDRYKSVNAVLRYKLLINTVCQRLTIACMLLQHGIRYWMTLGGASLIT